MPPRSVAWVDKQLGSGWMEDGEFSVIMIRVGIGAGVVVLLTNRRLFYGRKLRKSIQLSDVQTAHTERETAGFSSLETLHVSLSPCAGQMPGWNKVEPSPWVTFPLLLRRRSVA